MKCYYTLFTKEGLINNIGNYIFLFIILIFVISAIFFYKCGYYIIENTINEVLNKKKETIKISYNINEINNNN
jgi:predicted small metal-binding protein